MRRIAMLPLSYLLISSAAAADVKMEFVGFADTDGTGHPDTQVWHQSTTPPLLQLSAPWSRTTSYAANAGVSTPDLVNWTAVVANSGIDPRYDAGANWRRAGNQPLPTGTIVSGTRRIGVFHVYNGTWTWYDLASIYNYTIKIFGNANLSGGDEILAVPTTPLSGTIGQVSASVIDDTARTMRHYTIPGNRPDAPSAIEVAQFDASGANQAALVYGTINGVPRVLQTGQSIQPMVFFIDDRARTTWQGPDFSGASRQQAINTTAAVDGVRFENVDGTAGKEVFFSSVQVAYGGISYAARNKWIRDWGNRTYPWAHDAYGWAFGQADGTLGSEIYEIYAFGIFIYNRSTGETDEVLWADPYYNTDPFTIPTGLWDPFTNASTADAVRVSRLWEASFQARPYSAGGSKIHFGFGGTSIPLDYFQPYRGAPQYYGIDVVDIDSPWARYGATWKVNYDPMPDPQPKTTQLQGGLSMPVTLQIRPSNVATTYTITTDNPSLGTVSPTTLTMNARSGSVVNAFTVTTARVTAMKKLKIIVTGPGGNRAEREITLWP